MNLNYVINRLLFVVVVLFTATTVNFFLPRLSGQDPIRERILKQIQGGVGGYQIGGATDEIIKQYDRQFGLDKPLWLQYFFYLGNLARLDFGSSIANYPKRVDA